MEIVGQGPLVTFPMIYPTFPVFPTAPYRPSGWLLKSPCHPCILAFHILRTYSSARSDCSHLALGSHQEEDGVLYHFKFPSRSPIGCRVTPMHCITNQSFPDICPNHAHRVVLYPNLKDELFWCRLNKVCGVSFGDVQMTDLDFADDAVLLTETVDILAEVLETLSYEAGPRG